MKAEYDSNNVKQKQDRLLVGQRCTFWSFHLKPDDQIQNVSTFYRLLVSKKK